MAKPPRTQHLDELDSRFLTVTALLLFLLGAPVFLSFIQEPKLQSPLIEAIDSDRGPASISENTSVSLQQTKNTTVEVSCELKEQVEDVQANYLRLRGMPCGSGKNEDEIAITNKSNGYTAAIIFTPDASYTTDYIDLNDGENQLTIESTDKFGNKNIKSMLVRKRSMASVHE